MSQLHTLWGKAKDHPDYNKKEWTELQAELENLLAFVRKISQLTVLSKLNITKEAIDLSDEAKTLYLKYQ